MKVSKKVVVITGGGNGLGRELVRQLVARGASVAAVDIDRRGLHETIASLPSARVAVFEGSVTDSSFVQSLPAQVTERFGNVDGLFNNAGIVHAFARFHELEAEAVKRVFDVNLLGTVSMMQAFLPQLVARPEAHLLNVASVGGLVPLPGASIYGASKAAIKLLTETIRFELMHTNVRVSLALPGQVQTNILANSGVTAAAAGLAEQLDTSKAVSAEQAAKRILDGVEANASQILVGTDAKLLSLFHRLSPGAVAGAVGKQLSGVLRKATGG
jgi:short-subunit dehydrogenase